jgi:hypothetical protein
MRLKLIAVTMLTGFLAYSVPAIAQQTERTFFNNIGMMRNACLQVGNQNNSSSIEEASERLLELATCVSYSAAAGFFVSVFLEDNGCPNSAGTTSPQAIAKAFVNWADKNPARWDDAPPTGFMLGIAEAWGCTDN